MKITTVHYGLANSLVFDSILIFVFQNFSEGIPTADETRHKRGKPATHLALSGSGLELLIRLAAMEMLQFPGRQHGYHDGPLPEIYHFYHLYLGGRSKPERRVGVAQVIK